MYSIQHYVIKFVSDLGHVFTGSITNKPDRYFTAEMLLDEAIENVTLTLNIYPPPLSNLTCISYCAMRMLNTKVQKNYIYFFLHRFRIFSRYEWPLVIHQNMKDKNRLLKHSLEYDEPSYDDIGSAIRNITQVPILLHVYANLFIR